MEMASYELLEEIAQYAGFGAEDAARLVRLGPLLEPDFDGVVDHFYAAIDRSPGARAVFENEEQIARQKLFLRDWLVGIFGGVYDEAYFERRARIGRVHVRIGMPQRYMFAAMDLVRADLHASMNARLPAAGYDEGERAAAARSVDRILDLELAIMLETYAEDFTRRMRTTERLATLGQLAASIGHELRNPLAVMQTSLHLLERSVESVPKAAKHTARIGAQVAVCGEIISSLLDMARDRPAERKWIRPGDVVAEALALLPSTDVSVEVTTGDREDRAHVDPGQLRQLVVNLVSNAIEATRGRGSKVTIDARVEDGALLLRVDDEGPGLSEEVREHLFEPLFTTRAKGIGLGLPLCQRIVERHGGTIVATNRPEGGARFDVRLPPAPEPEAQQ